MARRPLVALQLKIDPIFGVAAHIPAGIVSEMRKQRMNAGLILSGQRKNFCPAVLQRDGIVVMDGYVSVGVTISPDFVAQDGIINGI